MIAITWSLARYVCPSWSSITDESALRSALASLDDSSSSLHWWLGFWTFVVVLGVVLEVAFVAWEYLDGLRDFRRATIHSPERPKTLLFVLGLVGAGLVAAGVSGELWKESQIAKLETCIRKGNDALFLLLSKEAGDARQSAKIAHDEADKAVAASSNALTLAGGARKEADSFERDIVSAKTQAADAESHLAEALKQAADAKAELHRLESPRSLTNIGEIVSVLKTFKGTEYVFTGVANLDESASFLMQVDSVLQEAGWVMAKVSPPSMESYAGMPRNNGSIPVRWSKYTGVLISTTWPDPDVSLNQKLKSRGPMDCRGALGFPFPKDTPPNVKAALVLSICLESNTSPPQPRKVVQIAKEQGATVGINIGTKP